MPDEPVTLVDALKTKEPKKDNKDVGFTTEMSDEPAALDGTLKKKELKKNFFQRDPSYKFTGNVFLRFSDVTPAARFCLDIFSSSALCGGSIISPTFVKEPEYVRARKSSLPRDEGAGATICVAGLPTHTTALEVDSWMAPHRTLAFNGPITLFIKPIGRAPTRPGKHPRPKSPADPNVANPSSDKFLIRLSSEAEAHLLASRLHLTPFNPSTYGDRYQPSVFLVY
ncbi:hypothetical protein L0F63_002446 [Massospora cicadina]|nr:hypothetical protein L0F63_002446 [Massospora cicadina]